MMDAKDFNGIWSLIQQALAKIDTNTLVRVESFAPAPGGSILAGIVTLQPLVNQIDPSGNATPHGIITGVPYFRLQAGESAIIIDPVEGDIGLAGFCSRDISTVKNTVTQSNPGSFRRFSMSDAIYFGGIGSLNGEPTEFIKMSNGAGIEITTPGPFTINAAGRTWTFGAAGLAMSNGIVEETHQHISESPGTPTGEPIA